MKVRRLLSGLLVVCMLLGSMPADTVVAKESKDAAVSYEATENDSAEEQAEAEQPEAGSSAVAPAGYVPEEEEPLLGAGDVDVLYPDRKVLLIQDALPWSSNANSVVLSKIAPFDVTKTSNIGTMDLSGYDMIVYANDQAYSAYNSFAVVRDKLETYVEAGGVLILGACDGGWASGKMLAELPGGIMKTDFNDYDYHNYIVDSSHPVVTAVMTEGVPLVDADLYHNYCSHIYFLESSLPAGTNVILKNENNHPTLVEFPFGNGTIIASGLTWEHNYDHTYNGRYARKVYDDLMIYGMCLSTGDRIMTPQISYTVPADKVAVYVGDSDDKSCLEGATVTINGVSVKTDKYGVAEFSLASGDYVVVVEGQGYLKKTKTLSLKQGGMKPVYMFKTGVTVTPAIDDAVFIDGGKETDIINQRFYFTAGETTEVSYRFSSELVGKDFAKYVLSQGTTIVDLNGPTGKIKPGEVFSADSPIYLEVVCTDGTRSKKIKTGIFVKEASSGFLGWDPEANKELRLGPGVGFTVPGNLPIIGGTKFDIGIGDLPIAITSEGNKVCIAVGITDLAGIKDSWTDFKKSVDEIQKTQNRTKKLREVCKKWGAKSGGFTISKGWDKPEFEFCGYVEAEWDPNKKSLTSISGKISGAVEFKYSHNQQFVVGPVPVYFEIGCGFKFELSAQVTKVLLETGEIQISVPFTFTPSFTIGGGAGINGAISVGAEGTASLPISIDFTKQHLKVSLEGSMSLKASLLFVFKAEHEIAKGTWVIVDKPFNQLGKDAVEDPETLLNYNDAREYTLIERDYLGKSHGWNGGNEELLNAQGAENYVKLLEDWVLPGSIPQIVTAGGKSVMVFQSDNRAENAIDCVSLMYSVLEGDTWSDPQLVWQNTGEADFYAQLVAEGDEIYLVWQKSNTVSNGLAGSVSGNDLETTVSGNDPEAEAADEEDPLLGGEEVLDEETNVTDLAKNMEIAYAKFDGNSNCFTSQKYITNNACYDGSAVLTRKADGTVTVVWVENENSDILSKDQTDKIMYSTLGEFGFSVPAVMTTVNQYILTMDAAYIGDVRQVAYSADADGDLNTADDVECYLYSAGEGNLKHLTPDTVDEDGAPKAVTGQNPQFLDGNLYWFENGQIVSYSVSTGVKTALAHGTANYRVLKEGTSVSVIYSETDEQEKDHFYLFRVVDGKAGNAVRIASTEGKIDSFDASWNGSNYLLAVDENRSGNYCLVYQKITASNDLVLDEVSADDRDYSDGKQTATLYISNDGLADVNSFKVAVCENGRQVDELQLDAAVASGESKTVEISFDRNLTDALCEYTFAVSADNDRDTTNNEATVTLGYTDIALDVEEYYIGNEVELFTTVKNLTEKDCGVKIRVYEDSLEGDVVFTKVYDSVKRSQPEMVKFNLDMTKMNIVPGAEKKYIVVAEAVDSAEEASLSDNTYTALITTLKNDIIGVELEEGKKVRVFDFETHKDKVVQIKAVTYPANANVSLGWESTNPAVATVDQSGNITIKGIGETVISAGTDELTKGSVTVRVLQMNKTAPSGLKKTEETYNSVSIAWDALADLNAYEIYRSTSKDGNYTLLARTANTKYQDSDVEIGKTYFYKVRGYLNDHGERLYTMFSDIISAAPVLGTPVATVSSQSATAAKVSWRSITGAKSYEVYRSNAENGDYAKIGTTTYTYYEDKTVALGNTYYYKVTAVCGDARSTSTAVKLEMVLPAPSYMYVSQKDYRTVRIYYYEVTGASGYEVYRSESKDGKYSLVATSYDKEVFDSDLKVGKTYYYKVRAYAVVNGSKCYSDYTQIKSLTMKLTTPSFSTLQGAGDDQIYMNWKAIEGATGYEIYSSSTAYGTYTKIATTTDTEYLHKKLNANTYYYYKIKAYRTVGKENYYSDYSGYRSASTGFYGPYNVKVTFDGSANTITFGKCGGAAGTEISMYDSASGEYKVLKNVTGTSFTQKSIKPFTYSYYKLRSYRKVNGETQYSNYVTVSLFNTVQKVEDVKVTGDSAKSLKLTWKEVPWGSGYDIYRKDSSNGSLVKVGTVSKKSTTSYVDKKLVPGKVYYYSVRAYATVDGSTRTGYDSDIASGATTVGKTVANVSSTYHSAIVSWSKRTDVDGYEVYRSTSKNGEYALVKTVEKGSAVRFEDKSVSYGKTYYYKVRAFCAAQNNEKIFGDLSNALQIKISLPAAEISSIKVTATAQAQVTWKKVAGASGYEVYRSTKKASGYKLVKRFTSGKTVKWTDTKQTCGTTYYYKVRVFRKVGAKKVYGNFSAVKSVIASPAQATLTKVSSPAKGQVKLTWKKQSQITGYVIYRSTKKTGKYTKVATIDKAATTSYVDKKVSSKKTYYYKIAAYKKVKNKNVCGEFSAVKSVKCK